jgi:hypothetical protein
MEWFWQGQFNNVFSWVLIALIMAGVGYLKLKGKVWVSPILYALCAGALTALLLLAMGVLTLSGFLGLTQTIGQRWP